MNFLDQFNNNKRILITGSACSGKTTLLKELCNKLSSNNKIFLIAESSMNLNFENKNITGMMLCQQIMAYDFLSIIKKASQNSDYIILDNVFHFIQHEMNGLGQNSRLLTQIRRQFTNNKFIITQSTYRTPTNQNAIPRTTMYESDLVINLENKSNYYKAKVLKNRNHIPHKEFHFKIKDKGIIEEIELYFQLFNEFKVKGFINPLDIIP